MDMEGENIASILYSNIFVISDLYVHEVNNIIYKYIHNRRAFIFIRVYVNLLPHYWSPPLAWSEGRGAIVDFAQANLLTARLVQAVQSKESSNGADEVH